eukprot:UN20116
MYVQLVRSVASNFAQIALIEFLFLWWLFYFITIPLSIPTSTSTVGLIMTPKPFDFHDLEVLSDSLIRSHCYCYIPQKRNLAFVHKRLSRWPKTVDLFAKYL